MFNKKRIMGSSEKISNKYIIFISAIDEKLTKGFTDILKTKLNKSIIILQSKVKKNITNIITKSFKKNDIILLCGSNLMEFKNINHVCHIHISPIECINYDDIKKNKNIILSRTHNKNNNTWDKYWENLMALRIDEMSYPSNYCVTSENVIKLLNIYS